MLVSLVIVLILPQPHGIRALIASTILRLIFSVGLEPTLFLLGAFNVSLRFCVCVCGGGGGGGARHTGVGCGNGRLRGPWVVWLSSRGLPPPFLVLLPSPHKAGGSGGGTLCGLPRLCSMWSYTL